jgi:hypothetical protein
MGLGLKFIDHVFYTPTKSLTDGMRAGARFGVAGALAGGVLGAVLGGVRLMSPVALIDTAMRSDEEIVQRGEDLFKDL